MPRTALEPRLTSSYTCCGIQPARSCRMSTSQAFDAAVLLAHGARDGRWLEPFKRMRDRLEPRLGKGRVAMAYLEFAPPSFAEAVAALAESGARHLLIVPVFLSGGGHVLNDVPKLL